MRYDFESVIDRNGTDCVKYDSAAANGKSEDLLPVWVADMDFKAPTEALDALHRRVDHGIFGYTFASDTYRRSVVAWFERHHSWSIEQDWIVTTPGVVFALSMAVRAFSLVHDTILIQPPVYYPFKSSIELNERCVVTSPLVYEAGTYRIDFDAFREVVAAERPKVFILCNPHNPVGRAWSHDELRQMGDICREYGTIIVSDEIHADFALPGHTHTPYASLGPAYAAQSVTCTAPSKTFNLAGLETSNIVIPDAGLRKRFVREVRRCGLFDPNTLGLVAGQACYENGDEWLREMKATVKANLDYLRDRLQTDTPRLKLIEPESTYLAWIDCREVATGSKLVRLVEDVAGLWVDMGDLFGPEGEGFIRINVACPLVTMIDVCDRLKRAFG